MELGINNNYKTRTNFGMALNIKKGAEPFVESLTSAERKYTKDLGNRIQYSRNDINIDEFGKITLTYRPKPSEIRLVNDANREAVAKEMKEHKKQLKSEMTLGEKVDTIADNIKTIVKSLKIKMSFGKSKFMKNLQISEEFQKSMDKSDELQEKLENRLNDKKSIAQKESNDLMAKFGKKE